MKFVALTILSIALAACANISRPVDADFDRVRQGMTRAEVETMLGKPHETMPFPLSGNMSWDYYLWDQWGYLVRYSVTFSPQGLVVSKIAQRLNDGGDHSK